MGGATTLPPNPHRKAFGFLASDRTMTVNRATMASLLSTGTALVFVGMWACGGGQAEPAMPPPGAPATVQMTPPSSAVPAASEAPAAAPASAASAAPVAPAPAPTSGVAN